MSLSMRDRDEDLTEVTVYSNNPWLLENASPLFDLDSSVLYSEVYLVHCTRHLA